METSLLVSIFRNFLHVIHLHEFYDFNTCFNPRAYKRVGGGGWMPPPKVCIFDFCMPFSVAVHLSLRHILAKFSDNKLLWQRDMTS